MKKTLFLTLSLLIVFHVSAQTDSIGFSLLPKQQERNLSINPDFACVKFMRTGSKWNNKVGATIPLLKYSTAKQYISLNMAGFINLHDISENQLMSWQMWRGNLGLDINYRPLHDSKHHNLVVSILLHHESQHVTDINAFGEEFLGGAWQGLYFNNASARSFEYAGIQVKDEYEVAGTGFSLYGMLNARIFSVPVLPNAVRQQTSAFATELGFRYKPFRNKQHFIYLHTYYEQVLNDFVGAKSQYQSFWNKQPFVYNIYELGFFLANARNKNNISVFAGYNNSNGRGLDFVRQYSEMYGGIRFNL